MRSSLPLQICACRGVSIGRPYCGEPHQLDLWRTSHAQDVLNARQTKVLNRLLDDWLEGFEGGLSAAKYKGLAKVSKATATRHLQELLDKSCIVKLAGGGRSTCYEISWPK